MASDILNSEIFQAVPTDKKTSTSKTATEVKKEGLSLFDTLLKGAQVQASQNSSDTKQVTKEVVKSNLETIQKETNVAVTTTKKMPVIAQESQDGVSKQELIKSTNSDNTKVVNPSSLNTKVLLSKDVEGQNEATQGKVKTTKEQKTSEQVQKNQTVSNQKVIEKDLSNSSNEQQIITNEKKSDTKVEAQQNTKNSTTNPSSKTEIVSESSTKAPLSLLDKMMQDIKQEVLSKEQQNSQKTANNTQTTTSTTTKPSTVETQTADEKIVVAKKVESTKTQKVIVQKENSQETNSTTKQTENLKEISKESKVSSGINSKVTIQKEELKETQTTKLAIEKLVLESDDTATQESEKVIDTKQTEVKQIVKNEDVVGKLFAELTSGIKSENKVIKNSTETTQTKQTSTQEDKVLASLVDSITGKTKIQKEIEQKEKLSTLETPKGQFGANAFLSNQKIQSELLSKQKLNEAKQVLTSGENSVKSVKKASEILDLNASKIEMSEEKSLSSETPKQEVVKSNQQEIKSQQTFLNRMFLQKDTTQLNSISGKTSEEKVSETKNTTSETATTTKDVTVTVERSLVETFTTKVIASKQMMGSFMSDVARNMYLNYKPPVTAFKINLDPLNLGSIAIVMRNNKSENSLSISLNMSQSGTLDTFNDNKSILQNALGKAFNQNEANISLDFGMQNGDSNQEFEQFRQNQEGSERRNNLGGNVNQIITENEEGDLTNIETTRNYM